MQNRIFERPKSAFLDTVDLKNYIQFDRRITLYQTLKETVGKPLKMILLYGKPGTGKSMLLAKLHKDLSKQSKKIFLYSTPLLDESTFLKSLASDIYAVKYNGELNFTQFMKIANEHAFEDTPIILLDEAQLYSDALMEKIRLLSDSRVVKFVIVLHKTQEEDILAKEHFKTRIWESIELQNADISELKLYIQKKIMKVNCFDIANMFNDKTAKKIYDYTQGNYRETNKLLYTLFEIYSWYEQNQPDKIGKNSISIKFLEMAAIQTGFINA
jgi:4-hydroxy-tetrahydrodipicolinate synthase